MYNYYGAVPYQQQLMQNRINQMEQYNPYQQQQAQTAIKGRPVSSYDEAKASLIDLDGSMFVFPDISNGCIYTKQIMLDGSAEIKTYKLVSDNNTQKEYVLKEQFEQTIEELKQTIETLRGELNES